MAAGCGGDEEPQSEPAPASTTTGSAEPPPPTTEVQPAPTETAKPTVTTARDSRGDTKAPDLDIIEATISRDSDLIRVAMTLAQAPTDDVIYSAMLGCGEKLWQLGYKRAAGTTTIFAFDFGGQQYEADGDATGGVVSIAYPAADMGCTGALDVQFIAEGTNDRCCPDPMSDYVPEPGSDALNPNKLHLP